MLEEVVDPWPRRTLLLADLTSLICRLVSADVESARLEWELAYRDVAAMARDPVLEERLRSQLDRDHDGAPATSRRHVHAPRARQCVLERRWLGARRAVGTGRPGMASHAGVGRGRGLPRLCARGSGLRTVTMLERPSRETGRARARRRRPVVRAALIVIGAVLVFLLGIAFARTLDERPKPTGPETIVRTLHTSSTRRAAPHGDRDGHHSRLQLVLTRLVGCFEQPGEDDPDGAGEADPDADPAAREEEAVGDRDDAN